MSMTTQIDTSMTVNDVVRLYPSTISIFNQHGIDTCCGGALPVAVAAERHQVDLLFLLQQLKQAIEAA